MSGEFRRRLASGLSALLVVAVAATGLIGALEWIGKPFPGFLVLANRVVASASVDDWPATHGGEIYQHEVVAVDDVPVASAAALSARVAAQPVGTPLTYRFRRGDRSFERTVPTRRFGLVDFCLLFGVYLLNGTLLLCAALVVLARGRGQPGGRATLPFLLLSALWGLSALDLYGPYRLFRLHAGCEALLFAAALHMAFGFPQPRGRASVRRAAVGLAYALGLGLVLVYQRGLGDPTAYVHWHLVATGAGGLAVLALLLSQLARYLLAASDGARRQIAWVAVGAIVALALPVCLTLTEPLTGGRAPQNAVGFTAFLFPLAIGFAVLRRGLLAAR